MSLQKKTIVNEADKIENHRKRFILLIDSQPNLGSQLTSIIDDNSISVATTTDWKRAIDLKAAGKIDLMICDLDLPDDGAKQLHADIAQHRPQLLSSLLFARNSITRPEASFLSSAEKRELLDKPFKNDQAQKILLRRLTRL